MIFLTSNSRRRAIGFFRGSLNLDNGKRYKKGEYLFQEGDLTKMLYIIERGRVALTVERNGKKIELATMTKSQILGEQSIFSNARQSFNAEAIQECQIMEVPVDLIKSQFANSPPGVKLIMKSLVDEVRAARQMLRSIKMSQDSSPCPQVSIPRIFCILNLVTRHTGRLLEAVSPEVPEGGPAEVSEQAPIQRYKVDFGTIKLYTSRMFAESPQRMKNLVDLLQKLDYLETHYMKNDDGDEELDHVVIKDLQAIEDFSEFYQYNLYKGGKSEVIYVDMLAFKVANALVEMSKDLEVGHKGAVSLDYDEVLQKMKDSYKMELKATHLDILEKKGLFVQRVPNGDSKTDLKFDKVEFQTINSWWKIIHEIDKWNTTGSVDVNERESLYDDVAKSGCPGCKGEVLDDHKFCPHCGYKMTA